MAKELRIWNGRSPGRGIMSRGTAYVAAYSVKQACEILGLAFNVFNVSVSEIKNYYSPGLWGTHMDGIVPTEPCVYYQKDYSGKPVLLYTLEPVIKIKLSPKQKEIIRTLRDTGKYGVDNCQNKTIRNMISLKLVDFNEHYNGLVLTELGKTIEL